MSETIFNEGILKGRVAFVTGGGTGITGGVARALAEAGAAVALVSRKLDHLIPAAQAINENGGKAIAVVTDVRQPEEVEKEGNGRGTVRSGGLGAFPIPRACCRALQRNRRSAFLG